MPLPWSKSNRTQGGSPDPSSAPSVSSVSSAQQRYSPEFQQPHSLPGQAQSPYRQQFPARSSSYRHSSNLSLDHPPPNVPGVADVPSTGNNERPPEQRHSYHPQSNPPAQYVQQSEPKKEKQSLRSRIVAGLAGHSKDEDSSRSGSSKNGLGRKVSVRRGEGPPAAERYNPQGNDHTRLQTQQWTQGRGGSSPNLPSSVEEDESNLDPFLQQDDDRNIPQVPPKDIQYQQPPQQYPPSQLPEQYRPPLARVDTDSSGVDHYSSEPPSALQPTQQQQQYQSYHPVDQRQQQQQPPQYQAFQPQSALNPPPSNAQLHPQDIAQQQQNYYYQQPSQHQGNVHYPQSQQSPQSQQPENIHYQQQQYSPSQPRTSHEYQTPQGARPQSQHLVQTQPPELHHPQASQQVPVQLLQQNPRQVQVDPQHNQQLRPPSQHQLAPPSPLTPQQYQYDPRPPPQGPAQQGDTRSLASNSPDEQTSMAPSSNAPQARNTLRKVNDASQQNISGAPSRESSTLQPSHGQGQKQPPTPGVESFGANVVPSASQGQPYRGDKQGQAAQGNETGQATPPPRSATDLTDEEVQQLLKEHDVLREKYQKVKRYFFEQQTQVHQLQNTLANQRLSLSRTSWDDSEYATRFNRLDGLIAQLSFAIRKDWKTIPPWLQPIVNKTAVETGKQEMTAVGRAFISSWLVEQVFEKYFHPDLEPGLSTQLKTIQLNIRRFAPACQNGEEEEALVSKVVNWRLATLEGLAEMLRSPHGAQIRHNLIEELNEKLIASLQMHMNDPAPPDLNGGVPMIVELAVNIAQHLPLESRDVHIEYFPPGHGILPEYMKIETGIPALTNPILDPEDADRASLRSVASGLQDSTTSSAAEQDSTQSTQTPQSVQSTAAASAKDADGKKSRGMFGGLMGSSKKPTPTSSKRESTLGAGGSQQSLQQPPGSSSGPKEDPTPRVRMAVGVAVQIRGKSILIKAPVYSS